MFSGAVKIAPDALNDFIAPSQDCVVALDGGKLKLDDDGAVSASSEDAFSTGEVALRRRKPREDDAMAVDAEPTSTFTPTMTQGDALKVSLSDCLACSGCVTSAESVLLEQQSVDEFAQACARARSDGRGESQDKRTRRGPPRRAMSRLSCGGENHPRCTRVARVARASPVAPRAPRPPSARSGDRREDARRGRRPATGREKRTRRGQPRRAMSRLRCSG